MRQSGLIAIAIVFLVIFAALTIDRGKVTITASGACGTATITSGGTNATVAHSLGAAPSQVLVTGRHAETADAVITARTTTNFTITVPNAVTADRQVDWCTVK